MTISLRAAGTATAATAAVTAVNPAVPTGTTTGDISVLTVWMKPFGTTITTPAGWTKIGEATNGTTAAGTDTGSTKVAVFVRESAPVGAIGNLTLAGSPNSVGAVINSYQKTRTAWDRSAWTSGGDSTNGANYSATGAAGISVAAGDWVVQGTAVCGDVGTLSAFAIAGMSGATLGTYVSRQNAAVTTGTDTRGVVGDIPVSTGSSTAAPTFTYTNASNGSGTTIWLRLRETDGATVAGVGAVTGAATVVVQGSATVGGVGAVTGPASVNNLLTANQASGGDTLSDATGFVANGAGVTLAYSTAQQYQGAGSMSAVIDGTTAIQGLYATIPANTFAATGTFTFFLRARVSATITYNFSAVNDSYGTMLVQVGAQTAANGWVTYSGTIVDIGAGAAAAASTLRFGNFDTPAAATIHVDTLGLWAGTSTEWAMPGGGTGDPVVIQGATASATGAGSTSGTASVTGGGASGTGTVAGVGAVTGAASIIVAGAATVAGVGSTSALATQRAVASATGAGATSGAALLTLRATATVAGAGSASALATQGAIASVAGVGATSGTVIQAIDGTATVNGVGSTSGVVIQGAAATVAGVGSVTASASGGVAGAATVTGVGATSGVVRQGATSSATGVGAVTAAATQTIRATATVAGVGSTSGIVRQGATAAVGGIGSTSATAAQTIRATATVVGVGVTTANANGTVSGTATVAGVGSVTAKAIQGATASASGVGAVAAVVTQGATAAELTPGEYPPGEYPPGGGIVGIGAVTATATVGGATVTATGTVAGAGSVTAVVTQVVTAATLTPGEYPPGEYPPGGGIVGIGAVTGTATVTTVTVVSATAVVAGNSTVTALGRVTAVTYRFRPPTTRGGPIGRGREFWFYQSAVGLSILVNGATVTEKSVPSDLEVQAADAAYLGGHEYVIDADAAQVLIDAGYADRLTPELVEV